MAIGRIVDIGHAIIHTRDMARSVAFYRDILGLRQILAGDTFNEFRVGTVDLCIMYHPVAPREHMTGSERPCPAYESHGPHVNFDFTTDDIEACRARLIAAGVACGPIVELEGAHPYFTFADPDGTVLTVWTQHHPTLAMAEVARLQKEEEPAGR